MGLVGMKISSAAEAFTALCYGRQLYRNILALTEPCQQLAVSYAVYIDIPETVTVIRNLNKLGVREGQ
ncbi:hypothetical protein D3C80_2195110 [compost metagenome]